MKNRKEIVAKIRDMKSRRSQFDFIKFQAGFVDALFWVLDDFDEDAEKYRLNPSILYKEIPK